jgi:hypothetical protein
MPRTLFEISKEDGAAILSIWNISSSVPRRQLKNLASAHHAGGSILNIAATADRHRGLWRG